MLTPAALVMEYVIGAMAVLTHRVWFIDGAPEVSTIVPCGFTVIVPFKDAEEQPPEVVTL